MGQVLQKKTNIFTVNLLETQPISDDAILQMWKSSPSRTQREQAIAANTTTAAFGNLKFHFSPNKTFKIHSLLAHACSIGDDKEAHIFTVRRKTQLQTLYPQKYQSVNFQCSLVPRHVEFVMG